MKTRSPQNTSEGVIMAYLTQEGTWRGFVYPYDITTETTTKKDTVEALKSMAKLYCDMLEEYGHPVHLAKKEFSNPVDREFYEKSIDSVNGLGLHYVETLST